MKRFLLTLFCILVTLMLLGCRSSKNLQNNEQINYSSELQRLNNSLDSLHLDVNKYSQITSEKLSNLKLENTTTYFSLPDSTGKQYKVKQSTTNIDKQDQEHTQIYESIAASLTQLSNRIDSINYKVDELFDKQEVVKELSWWDLHKDKVYLSIISVAVGLMAWVKFKK